MHLNPNPVLSHLQIETETSGEYIIDLLDLSGRLILSEVRHGSEQQIDLSFLPAGTYIICIRLNGQIVSKKLIKY